MSSSLPRSYRSGELAAAAGLSPDALRYYERQGLIAAPERLPNGYRRYPSEALARVLLIQRALSVGFTVAELARLLRARARGAPPCGEVRAMAREKLREIEERLNDLISFRDSLARTLADWDARLSTAADGTPAHLLESLSEGAGIRRSPLSALRFDRRRKRKGTP